MRFSILKSLVFAASVMAIVGCSEQSPVSVQSNGSQVASSGRSECSQLCMANDTSIGKMVMLAGNTMNTWTNLYYNYQGSPWAGWNQNTSIYTGAVATCNSGIGGQKRFYMFDIGTNYHAWYTYATDSYFPTAWGDMGAIPDGYGVVCTKAAKLGLSASSPLIAFASTGNSGGKIWFRGTDANGQFSNSSSSWKGINGGWDNFDVCTKNDGTIFVAYQATNSNNISYAIVTSPSSANVYSIQSFASASMCDIVVGKNLDGRMEIFAVSSNDGLIYHNFEMSANSNNWSGWTSYFGPSGRTLHAGGYHLAIGSNADGRLELFYKDFNTNYLYHTYQTAPNSGWADESALVSAIPNSEISVGKAQDGRLYVGYNTSLPTFWSISQHAPNSYWDAPVSLGDYK